MLNAPIPIPPGQLRTRMPLRAAWAAYCTALLLAGCGGSDSADAPAPAPQLATPSNFKVTAVYGGVESLRWSATPGATRYELYADPDGQGPLPEAKLDDYTNASPRGFRYVQDDSGGFTGSIVNTYAEPSVRLNATYRLRACDSTGCGAFTNPQAFDITQGTSYGFASGYSPLTTNSEAYRLQPVVSRDGLTLAIRAVTGGANSTVLVFGRSSATQPWVQQASLRPSDYAVDHFVLSSDGSTLAARAMRQISGQQGTRVVTDAVLVYQRTGNSWTQQARLDTGNPPAACTQPCQAELAEHMALSADGGLLALSATTASAQGDAAASSEVFTYTRTGTSWAAQASLNAEGPVIAAMTLSGNGSTLAVSARDPQLTTAAPPVLVLAQNGNGTWALQDRLPATLAVYQPLSGAVQYGTLALSSDGNTLAVHASNLQGLTLCSGAAASSFHGIALYARSNGAWQRQGQAAIALDGLVGGWAPWALASDGNALVYGSSMVARTNGTWVCA